MFREKKIVFDQLFQAVSYSNLVAMNLDKNEAKLAFVDFSYYQLPQNKQNKMKEPNRIRIETTTKNCQQK